uniref:Pre-mRNA 3'-end-processing factor FIP1 n=1 Tax=Trichuris muris TaxID=70415 RepID=A0A5S6QIX5_TRIMR
MLCTTGKSIRLYVTLNKYRFNVRSPADYRKVLPVKKRAPMAELLENALVVEEEGPDGFVCTEECRGSAEEAVEANGEQTSSPPDMADLVEVDEAYNDPDAIEEQPQEEETQAAEQEVSEEEDDDDDDDDVKITIGDVKTNINFPPPTMGPRGQIAAKFANKLDIDSTAIVNGAPVYELDLTSLEEHPWREPGADLTDYFNYGFTEETWNVYCDRQRRLRSEFGSENANRMFFNSIPSHYGTAGFDRNKGFSSGTISTITSLAPPVFPQIRNLVPVAPAEVPPIKADEAPTKDQPEDSVCPPLAEQPEKVKSPSSTSGITANASSGAPIPEVPAESLPNVNPLPMPIRQGPPLAGLHVPPGFPHGPMHHVPGLPITNIPPPGMLPPFGHPPPGLAFPPSFQFPPPARAMFPPRGYAGFRMPGRDEPAPSMASYSGASSDDDARMQGYDHYGKHGDYEFRHGRSRSPSDSRSYSRHSERRSRKHSRSPAHSRHRSRDDRPRGSTQHGRDGHSRTHSEKRGSERKDDGHDKDKSYRKKEDEGRKRHSKGRTSGRDARPKDSRKSKERDSKAETREAKSKDRRSKHEESDSKGKKGEKVDEDSEARYSKKRKKQKSSHHHSDRESDRLNG